jgi:hypothetical protein
MKENTSIGDELLAVLTQWYNLAIKRSQLIFPSFVH